jgi:hypothetical protein
LLVSSALLFRNSPALALELPCYSSDYFVLIVRQRARLAMQTNAQKLRQRMPRSRLVGIFQLNLARRGGHHHLLKQDYDFLNSNADAYHVNMSEKLCYF